MTGIWSNGGLGRLLASPMGRRGVTGLALAVAAMLAGAPAADARERGGLMLIAHRGGVVDEARTENSLPALDEAIRRGYSHVEVDLRVTRDGRVVCLHDRSLMRTTGVPVNVDEVTLAELHAKVDPAVVPTLETYAARAAGRIELMPDVKEVPPELVEAFKAGIRAALDRHGLMGGALFIGRQDIIRDFAGTARIAWRRPFADFEREVLPNPGQASRYFAFNHARDFDAGQVAGFRRTGVEVVVTVNTLHYLAGGDPMSLGKADIEKALQLGVDGLQIDSVYEPFAPGAAVNRTYGRLGR